ncbi:transposase [Streptosporangium sp. NPDC006930]|uniref:transposase n=1 Tax=unclassified Streptosporangium TaxID=2632669 RepID=UPI003438EF76
MPSRKNEPKDFAEEIFQTLLSTDHTQLGGPILLVWDSLPEHVSTPMHERITAHEDWPRASWLPPYAPDLNPAEGIWSALRTKLFNFTIGDIDQRQPDQKSARTHAVPFRPAQRVHRRDRSHARLAATSDFHPK